MIGETINNWTILENDIEKSTPKHKYVVCKCKCGKIKSVLLETIINEKSKSCGCINIKHNKSKSRIYKIWKGIKTRCYNKNNSRYSFYGGRGIRMCDEWVNNFTLFYDWSVENGYNENLSIDRIDVNGNYEPSNCRWVDDITQSNNCRTNIYVTLNGVTKTLKQWCREYKTNYSRVYYRVTHGWRLEDSLVTPPMR